MNRNYLFNVSIFIMLTMIMMSCNSNQEKSMDSKSAIDVIYQRSSIRSYRDRKVSREQLKTIVRAGMAAPSAMNKQPWMFIVIEDKDILEALGKDIQTSKMNGTTSPGGYYCLRRYAESRRGMAAAILDSGLLRSIAEHIAGDNRFRAWWSLDKYISC